LRLDGRGGGGGPVFFDLDASPAHAGREGVFTHRGGSVDFLFPGCDAMSPSGAPTPLSHASDKAKTYYINRVGPRPDNGDGIHVAARREGCCPSAVPACAFSKVRKFSPGGTRRGATTADFEGRPGVWTRFSTVIRAVVIGGPHFSHPRHRIDHLTSHLVHPRDKCAVESPRSVCTALGK